MLKTVYEQGWEAACTRFKAAALKIVRPVAAQRGAGLAAPGKRVSPQGKGPSPIALSEKPLPTELQAAVPQASAPGNFNWKVPMYGSLAGGLAGLGQYAMSDDPNKSLLTSVGGGAALGGGIGAAGHMGSRALQGSSPGFADWRARQHTKMMGRPEGSVLGDIYKGMQPG